MLRYVALAFFLLSCASSEIVSSAAGNIGCLFSETLCNQEKEWCIDDNAFGRCLPLYGNVRDEDMHRFELGTEELHVLELEMQRLFLLGYRWSHTYTQCVLQALLRAIRSKSPFNISDCNEELDQDLEGALKAIEGEEMEHVDARDLAIVRFVPSALNPHSDYADELYYPPLDEILGSQDKVKDNEKNSSNQEMSDTKENEKLNEIPSFTSTAPDQAKGGQSDHNVASSKDPEGRVSDIMKDHLTQLPPPTILNQPYYLDNDPYPMDAGDYDYDLGYEVPFGLPLNPVYKRNGYNSGAFNYGKMEDFYRERPTSSDLRVLAKLLSHLRITDTDKLNGIDFPLNLKFDKEDKLGGYFRETPSIPGYREKIPLFINTKNSVYFPYEKDYKLRGSQHNFELPELDIPTEEDTVPDTIHAGSVKEFDEEFYQNDQVKLNKPPHLKDNAYIKELYNKKYSRYLYDPKSSSSNVDNSVSRFENQPAEPKYNYDGYKTSSVDNRQNNADNEDTDYKIFQNFHHGYNDRVRAMPQNQQVPVDAYYGRPVYPNYRLNYEYYTQDYYQDYDYSDMPAGGHYNFQRNERLDVKKPGPGPYTKNRNEFGYGTDEGRGPTNQLDYDPSLITRLDPSDGDALLLAKMRQDNGFNDGTNPKLAGTDQFSDLMLTEKGFIADGIGSGRPIPPRNQKVSAHRQVSNSRKIQKDVKDKILPDSYVYISISRNFTSYFEAKQLVDIILNLAGLDMKIAEKVRVENNQVKFEIKKNNSLGMTAARLAERAEELRDAINTKTEMKIIQSGVGTKSALTAVVYSAGREQTMFTAAAIVCGVCAALLVAATVLFFLRQNTRSKAKLQGLATQDSEASKDYQDLCRARMSGKGEVKDSNGPGHAQPVGFNGTSHAPGQRISSLSKESDNGNKSPSSRSSTSSWSEEPVISNMDISTGHMVLSYMEDHLTNKDRLEQEWVGLCSYEAEPCSCSLALRPENAQKNRYPDAVPYDHNRVIVNEHTNVSGTNYVNASSITDHDPRNPAYIATQGPLASTGADFWQLVWEQGSVVIVMLTRLTENGHALCHRYWPEEGNERYHIYEVHLVSEHIWCDDYLVRSFYLKNVRTGETRTVTQFHFLSWPESGIPASTKALLEFRRKVNKSYRGRSCPIIVHCSDGIGRTGTFCLIDMVLNRMAKGTKEIDIAATLEHIRDQRPNMVKTKTQFEFVLMAVAEEVHAILKALPQ